MWLSLKHCLKKLLQTGTGCARSGKDIYILGEHGPGVSCGWRTVFNVSLDKAAMLKALPTDAWNACVCASTSLAQESAPKNIPGQLMQISASRRDETLPPFQEHCVHAPLRWQSLPLLSR